MLTIEMTWIGSLLWTIMVGFIWNILINILLRIDFLFKNMQVNALKMNTTIQVKLSSTNQLLLKSHMRLIEVAMNSCMTSRKNMENSLVSEAHSKGISGGMPTYTMSANLRREDTGNRNLTLRRSPHGNKKHRDIFVPSRWAAMVTRTIGGVDAEKMAIIQEAIRAQTLKTLVGMDITLSS